MSMIRVARRKILTEIVCVVSIGIVVSLLILEIGIRVYGTILEKRDGSLPNHGADDIRILCLGDSFVYGIGAGARQSFPAQLENILNAQPGGKVYRVVNQGFPGDTSRQVLGKLRDSIGKVNPQIVVLLCGGANFWKAGYVAPIDYFPITDKLWGLAVVRFARLLFVNLHEREHISLEKHSSDPNDPGSADTDNTAQKELSGVYSLLSMGNSAAALELLQRKISGHPSGSELNEAAGILYEHDRIYDKAVSSFLKSIETAPFRRENLAWAYLFYIAELTGDHDLYLRVCALLPPSQRQSYASPAFADAKKRAIIDAMEADYSEMIRVCRKGNIPVVMLDYPRAATPVNPYLKVIAGRNCVPLVLNDVSFSAMMSMSDRVEYFSDDGHCNARGYQMMARNIARYIPYIH